jgi:archaellum component FlaC
MEFNNKQITTAATSTTEVVADKIKLTSTERVNNASIKDAINLTTKVEDSNTVLVSHDTRDLKNTYNKDSIKTSLVTVYGKNNRIAMSSKDIETIAIPLSEFPARVEYNFTVMENNSPVEYKADYLIPTKDSSVMLPIYGKQLSSISEVTLPEAVSVLDDEIAKIKTNLQDFSFVYDKSQNKVVPLQQLIINLATTVDELSKTLNDVKKKVEDMQDL